MFFNDKKKVIIILFSAAFLMLLANIAAPKFFKKENLEEKKHISLEDINIKFKDALFAFGVKPHWVKEKQKGGAKVNYSVSLPKDLPATLILKEIYNSLDGSGAELSSTEKGINGTSKLIIKSSGVNLLAADFYYENNLVRESGSASFLLMDLENLNDEELTSLLIIPEQFGAILIPSEKSKELSKKLINHKKEFILLLNDEINELKYKLNENYSEQRLKSSVKEVAWDFYSAVFLLYDEASAFYNSKLFELVNSELQKREIKFYPLSKFINLTETGAENIPQSLKDYLNTPEKDEKIIFIMNAEDFLSIQDELLNFRKVGYRFISPSTAVISRQ